jgi:aspartate/methionine/tyrosine aminotransferase
MFVASLGRSDGACPERSEGSTPSAGQNEQLSPENIVLTVSTSEAYSFVFRLLCDTGDEVLTPAPSYPLFDYLADLQDLRLARYSLFYDAGWHIDFHSLESALTERSRAIVVVHPNNPTGSYISAAEAGELNRLCRRHALALVADEVFLDYSLSGPRASFAGNREALTFALSGISKIAGLPQMKAAWIVTSGPEALAAPALSRLEVISDTFLSMNAPVQLALPALLGQRQRVCGQLLRRIRANLAELDRQLDAQSLCTRCAVDGGWYAAVRVPVTGADEELAIGLLEQRDVLVQPGYFYDFPGDGFLVISLITSPPEFAEGVGRVLGFIAARK